MLIISQNVPIVAVTIETHERSESRMKYRRDAMEFSEYNIILEGKDPFYKYLLDK